MGVVESRELRVEGETIQYRSDPGRLSKRKLPLGGLVQDGASRHHRACLGGALILHYPRSFGPRRPSPSRFQATGALRGRNLHRPTSGHCGLGQPPADAARMA
jgi:hypothetical protein